MASKEAEGQIISQDVKGLKKRNSSVVPIHKLPECTDWLTNIRAFWQLISCTILSAGIFLTICVALVIIGGLKRISTVALLCLYHDPRWDYYSEKCLEYLSRGNMKLIKGYRWVYILAIFIGSFMTVNAVWTIADIFNGLMASPT